MVGAIECGSPIRALRANETREGCVAFVRGGAEISAELIVKEGEWLLRPSSDVIDEMVFLVLVVRKNEAADRPKLGETAAFIRTTFFGAFGGMFFQNSAAVLRSTARR